MGGKNKKRGQGRKESKGKREIEKEKKKKTFGSPWGTEIRIIICIETCHCGAVAADLVFYLC